MEPAVIVTDRPDRGRAFVEALRTVAECRVVGPAEPWQPIASVQGIVVDLALDRPDTARCLGQLCAKRGVWARPHVFRR